MAFKPLYEYTPQNAVQLAGTHSQFSLDNGQTWQPLKGLQQISAVGNKASTQDQTTIDDEAKRYMGAIKDGEDRDMEFLYYKEDTDQEALRTAANALKVVKIKHQWKNGVVATYEMALLGWSVSEGTVDDLMKFTISGKLNGDVAWSEAEQQV